MLISNVASRALVLAALGTVLSSSACTSDVAAPAGQCTTDAQLDCSVSLAKHPATNVGLLGYSCPGSARPDTDALYVDGVPQGAVCANRGVPGAAQSFCCTEPTTACALDPTASCDPGSYGYQCRGSTRPEMFNPAVTCGNGVQDADYVDYCCAGSAAPSGCTQLDSVGCSERLTGFACTGSNLPKAEQLGASQSRADTFRLLCPTPTSSPNGKLSNYCCFPPALTPIGASCVQDVHVPGCAPGRFGFACYGPESPDRDYPPMKCPTPGVPGTSDEGYPATVFCCDFQ